MMHSDAVGRNVWCGLWWQPVPSLGARKGGNNYNHQNSGNLQIPKMVATTVAPSLAYAAYPTGGDGRGTVASWHRSEQSADRTEASFAWTRWTGATAVVPDLLHLPTPSFSRTGELFRIRAVSSDQFMPRCHGATVSLFSLPAD
jgi:hypothetical protein